MNRTELKLSLVELFSKPKPVPIEHTQELFDVFKRDFWATFKNLLESCITNNRPNFSINRMCINWWHTSSNRLYALYRDTSESSRNEAYNVFTNIMAKELDAIGVPYALIDCYIPGLKAFQFDIVKLKKFSHAEQLGSLK
jgi:hypothetical protein